MDELWGVARYAVENAQEVLPVFMGANPEIRRLSPTLWDGSWPGSRTSLRRPTGWQRSNGVTAGCLAREIGRPAPRRALRGGIPPWPELEQRVAPCLRDVLLERVVDTEAESREHADGRPET